MTYCSKTKRWRKSYWMPLLKEMNSLYHIDTCSSHHTCHQEVWRPWQRGEVSGVFSRWLPGEHPPALSPHYKTRPAKMHFQFSKSILECALVALKIIQPPAPTAVECFSKFDIYLFFYLDSNQIEIRPCKNTNAIRITRVLCVIHPQKKMSILWFPHWQNNSTP